MRMSKKQRSRDQAVALGKVYTALMRDRWNLRRAARRAGSPRLKRQLHRLAFQRGNDAGSLVEAGVRVAEGDMPPRPNQTDPLDLIRIGEVGALAACLRSNRKLRVAIDRASATEPSPIIDRQLSALKAAAEREAGTIEARFAEATTPLIANPSHPTIVE